MQLFDLPINSPNRAPLQARFVGLAAGIAAGALLLAPPAPAQHLMVGGPDTLIRRTLPVTDAFDIVGACGGIVESMVAVGDITYIGDLSGLIYVHDPAVGVGYAFNSGNDAVALASDGQRLFVGGSNGSVESYDLGTETLLDVWRGPVGLRALTLVGSDLFAAGDGGVIVSTSVQGEGTFDLFASVGTPVTAMTSDGEALLAASSTGAAAASITRVDLASQAVTATFAVASDATALGVNLGQLLVAGSDGIVHRVDRTDGTVFDSMTVGSSVRALALTDGFPPAFSYCYGDFCPCGNDDSLAGCVNSTGRGARLAAAGTNSVAADDLALFMTGAPSFTTAIGFMASGFALTPLGDGLLCVGGNEGIQRLGAMQTNEHGALVIDGIRELAETQFGSAFQVMAGAEWHFQVWYRDAIGPCGSASNATNSGRVVFAP